MRSSDSAMSVTPLSSMIMPIRSLIPLLAIVASVANGAARAADGHSGAYEFSSRPWPLRYFLYIQDPDVIRAMNIKTAEWNVRVEKGLENHVYRDYEEFFPPERTIETPDGKLGIVLMTFSKTGILLTPGFNRFNFTAVVSNIGNLVLLKNGFNDKNNKPYNFANWWELPGSHIMSPAVCDGTEGYRYKTDNPKDTNYVGGFGCREWSAQLQDDDRPYIDVTSYWEADFVIIDRLVGWSGFDSKPKPVIGKYVKNWVCLHECPNGEEPGIISNIEEWTKKHGFPMPVRPKRQPEFPDSMFKDIYEE
ncbi:hypothetical protein [Pseudoduganella aquatica]|uniref:hypothetical protein n=1 Tax=Pseudoduganella aquatica TaxID=2660641 RepID=UPI001E3AC1D9|nr:hypothetical protein [Pseudoduganella aquatica]